MQDFSLIEKLDILLKVISQSPLFLVSMILGILLVTFLIICIILNKKVNKVIFIISCSIVGLILFINYSRILLSGIGLLMDSIFKALYFPSPLFYIGILILSNLLLMLSIFNKLKLKPSKVINIITAVILDILFILIIDIASKNQINIRENISLYTNSNLLVLLQLSMGIFTSNILINILIILKQKLKKYDIVKEENKPEIIFD